MPNFWRTIRRLFSRDSNSHASESRHGAYAPRYGAGSTVVYSPGFGGSAMSVATVYRCVKLLGDTVAGLRLQYMRRRGGCYREDTSSPYHYLLTVQPQPEMSA